MMFDATPVRRLTMGAALAASLAPAAWARDALRDHHDELLKRKDLQFSFESAETPPPPPGWLIDLFRWLDALGPIFNVLLWVVLGAGLLAIAWFIGRELMGIRAPARATKAAEAAVQPAPYRPSEEKARALLERADQLAAGGDYDGAARELLHRSIEDIEQHLPNLVKRSTTGREITTFDGLPAAARGAFELIARAVERSWFGGRPLTEGDWRACRKSYADFALQRAWA